MLAIAANHLMDSGVSGWRSAKLIHRSKALRQFQRTISRPIAKGSSDAVLMTCLMINVQYFSWVGTTNPKDPWIFSRSPDRIWWLSVKQGLGVLLEQLHPFLVDTKVLHYFYVFPTDRGDVRRLPQAMWELCDVTDEMGRPNLHPNPYHDALHALPLLMPFEPDDFMKYLHFGARIYPPYVQRLIKNDHRALLILSYWFGLIGSADIWWCRRRVQRDCIATCVLLDDFGSGAIRSLIAFPASVCGYVLSERRSCHHDSASAASPGVLVDEVEEKDPDRP